MELTRERMVCVVIERDQRVVEHLGARVSAAQKVERFDLVSASQLKRVRVRAMAWPPALRASAMRPIDSA